MVHLEQNSLLRNIHVDLGPRKDDRSLDTFDATDHILGLKMVFWTVQDPDIFRGRRDADAEFSACPAPVVQSEI
jgi:hypothetical protein